MMKIKFLAFLLITCFLVGADYRIKDGAVYSDITVEDGPNEQALLAVAMVEAGHDGDEDVMKYRVKNDSPVKRDGDKVMLSVDGGDWTEYADVAAAKVVIGKLTSDQCYSLVSLEQPVGSTYTELIDSRPCFDTE